MKMPTKEKLKIRLSDYLDNRSKAIEKTEIFVKGLQGEKGERGYTGERGPKGEIGLPGKDGRDGGDGKDGVSIKGDQGLPGLNGRDGKDGENSKEITLDQINELVKKAINNLPKPMGGMFGKIVRRGGSSLISNEVPTGAINGTNKTFTLANPPKIDSVMVYQDGVRLNLTGYTLSGQTLTLNTAPVTELVIDYTTK